ncbi:MAG: type II and III secretion system protein [Balneola sp.]
MKSFTMKLTKLFLCSVFVLMALPFLQSSSLVAQTQNPFREYTNPDEIVTFDRNTSYVEAIEILNQFVQEYENKFIVDLSGYSGSVGVSLPPMHWKEALNYILTIQDLELVEKPDYYEIVVPAVENNGANQQNAQGATGGAGVLEEPLANIDTREVRINATFFIGNKRALAEIGIDWSTLTNNVPANIQDFVSEDGSESIPQTAFANQFVSVNSVNASQVSQNVFNALVNLGEIGPGISVQALFSTFESNNMGSIIATPSIKVIDGKEGKIQDGQDFSVKQRDFAGNVTDEFFSTGTILTVTPTVIDYNDSTFIHLDIIAERSNAQPDAVSTIIQKQQVTTQTLLLDGEATAVAGLYTTTEAKIRRGVPFLKDLPGWFFGLKYLFGYNSTDRIENELVIIIQAELEKTLAERMDDKLKSKGTLLSNERDRFRNEMDYVIEKNDTEPFPVRDDEPDTTTVTSVPEKGRDVKVVEEKPEDDPQPDNQELTKDQKEELEELSMPIKDPELMVVVPKAFDLDEFLAKREEGEVIKDDSDHKYFVIGGSFIVPNNASEFSEILDTEGYDSRILFNPSTRFNYVAYYAFSDFDEAVEATRRMRIEGDPGTWLFTLEPEVEFKKQN